jgi:response regulator RpfG family c-di-GMP phosphodiesterase
METPLQDLVGCRVLLIEDEFYIADDLGQRLSAHGAILLGPMPTLERALVMVETADRIDGAVVDINLRGEMAFPVVDTLQERAVPLFFATGYNAVAIPDRCQHVPR